MSRRRLVIAGGGLAGHRIAYALQREADITLIDPKDFFEVPMAVPRMLVEPRRAADAIIPYREFLPRVTHIQGALRAVLPEWVTVAETEIPYDYLVLATGAAYQSDLIKPHGGSATARRVVLHQWAERIHGANRILIVGGGPVGVEIAAELVQDIPGKRVTLVHHGETLLPSITQGPQRYALSFLRDRGAEVILGQDAGREQASEGDLVIWCAGYSCDTSYLHNYPGNVLDPAGRVLVDRHLRLAGSGNIFAVGDITALPEPKMGIWAGKHAAVVIDNLRKLFRANRRANVRLAQYSPATGSKTMLVTLGRNHGTGHLPVGDFTNAWLARKLKSEDMFIGRYRKGIGLA